MGNADIQQITNWLYINPLYFSVQLTFIQLPVTPSIGCVLRWFPDTIVTTGKDKSMEVAMKDEKYEPYDPVRFRVRQEERLAAAPSRLGLSPEIIEKIRHCYFDRIVEKHEGPWDWDSVLRFDDLTFINAQGYRVLLPLDEEHYPHLTIHRCIPSQDEQSLTLFIQDTTYTEDLKYARWDSWFIAFCEKFPNENFYLATLYHEWYFVEPLLTQLKEGS